MAKKWTDEEVQFLKFAYPNKDFLIREIANELGRSELAIKSKAIKLGLKIYKEELQSGVRRCCKCKTILPLESFYASKKGKYGYGYMCKECEKERKSVNKESILGKETILGKQCTRCREVKPIDKFDKIKRNSDGYDATCKSCRKEIRDRSRLKKLKERGW